MNPGRFIGVGQAVIFFRGWIRMIIRPICLLKPIMFAYITTTTGTLRLPIICDDDNNRHN